jgi:RNA polymerase sigma-70 factor (ECF subfamily)
MAVITRRVAGLRARADRAQPDPTPTPAPPAEQALPVLDGLSWEEIVREHSARVYRLAYRLTGNPHDAEDLTQEVFVRVFRSLHTYTPDNFPGWLHRITTNLFLDKARRRSRLRFDALGDEAVERLSMSAPSSDRDFTDAMFDADIEQALTALPEEFRAAVVLCDVEGLSYDEIAEALDIKLGTVRSRIHRGRKMLRAALAHRAPSEGRTRFSGPLDPATVAT